MRIPLDYYRILGLPIQATGEQLQQAHRDRTLQLPRREYSEAAIAARRQLIDEAYAVLSDPTQRQAYDANFLAKAYDLEGEMRTESGGKEPAGGVAVADPIADSYTPSIEIQDDQLVGALLILLELGEYELVLKLGRPYLSSGSKKRYSLKNNQSDLVQADIVLTLAFACLELGREQWQQGHYENAAESLETGQELLLREGGFASVRGEIQADLFKLRPYRVLELLALPESNVADRKQGLSLLQDMLQDRGGIDGAGDDQSGLNTDDFLRFIQQLRSYLSVAEQQTLFEAEARRPSAVATYLAVYALLARGFGDREPALVRRAKLLLVRLGTRQDVHLEQAVCALLLGQTEEASRALELSHEYESLAFIREHSQGSPDLLPGLCLYSERWLQNEVFPHFRDLSRREASLKDYFADQQVQSYLEELPNEPEAANQWTVTQSAPKRSIEPLDPPQTQRNGTAPMPSAERIAQTPSVLLNTETPDRSQSRLRPPAVPRRRSAPRLDRLALMLLLGVLGIGVLGFLASRTYAWLSDALNPGPRLEGEQLDISISQPPIALPSSPA
ncbi:MAG: J domain-containing protein, partial [Microcoleus sp. SIO2G3]|nr:J domain-containing protein [Microcoleus sp. SIO2G3]